MSFSEHYNNFPKGWRRLISKWGELNSQYYETYGDLPAWHVENSNTALLSVAAWMCEYPAICEAYGEKKRFTGRRGRPHTYSGRIDMSIFIDDENYLMEAKRRCFVLSAESRYSLSQSHLITSLREVMYELENCRRCAEDHDAKMTGIVFFSGHIDPWAEERSDGSRPAQRREMVKAEVASMHRNIKEMANESYCGIHHAVFSQEDFRIGREWQGWDWPAVFGVCAALDV